MPRKRFRPATEEEALERKRASNRSSYYRTRHQRPADAVLYSRDPPPSVVEEAIRAAKAPRSLTAALMGDPPPGRRAIDQKNRTPETEMGAMTEHVVKKEFKTVNRIMKPGMPVAPGDHLEPFDFEMLKKRGFIGGPDAVVSNVQAGVAGPNVGSEVPKDSEA